jgi:hypothetical protein
MSKGNRVRSLVGQLMVGQVNFGRSVGTSFVGTSVVLALVLFCSLTLSAQTRKDGVVTINGGRNAIYTKAPRRVSRGTVPFPELLPIYSTLGPNANPYNGISGVGILGPDAGQPWPQRVGNGFILDADHVVNGIAVAATHVAGPNALIVTLNADDNGQPGEQLGAWYFSGLPEFGTCCKLQLGRSTNGITLKGGQVYWVVLEPWSIFPTTYNVWNNDYNDFQGTFNNDLGSGWQGQSYQQLGGFGVYGK